ncbi:MAG TPA: RagB/SusD family nutrient uptake outer membrane protein [Longimicrobiaceae bacterium]
MRRLLSILFTGGIVVSLGACDDFLSPDPATFASSETYFQTPGQMEQAVSGLYSQMANLYDWDWRELVDLRGEDVTLQFNINVPGFTFQLDEFLEATNDATVAGQYTAIFDAIFSANVILTRIDDVEFEDQAQKARIVAEAKFIRSLAFWQAIQLFGLAESWEPDNLAVPLILEEITNPNQAFELERATVQQVYDQIIADLTEAKAALPVRGSAGATGANSGRITRGAAAFLLGATYQLNPDPAAQRAALAEFESLEGDGYALITSGSGENNAYREIFNPANKNNIESILEIQYSVASENGSLRQNLVPAMAPLNSAAGGNAGDPQTIAVYGASGNGSYNPTQNHILSFVGSDPDAPAEPRDLRYEGGYGMFCPSSGISGVLGVEDRLRETEDITLGGPNTQYPELNIPRVRDPQTGEVRENCIPYFIKWRWVEHMPQPGRDNNNWIVFRYADALLRRAESHARLGEDAEALQHLNTVRERAGLPPLSGLSGQELLDAILRERSWELGGEGHRWLDLKRFGVASEVISEHGEERKRLVPRTSPSAYGVTGANAYRLRYPIRPRDVELSQCKILQNPGWGSCEGK